MAATACKGGTDRRLGRRGGKISPSITVGERRQAEAAGRAGAEWSETHRQLVAIVEQSNDAIFSRDARGIIRTWNGAAERMFGYRAREIVGHGSAVLLPRGQREQFRRLMVRMRKGEQVEHYETERLRKDGKRIHVSMTLSPIRDETGAWTGFSTIARDITEQKRVRESLERREHELNDLFEESTVGLMLTGADGRILRMNPALKRILGLRAAAGEGRLMSCYCRDRVRIREMLRGLRGRGTLRNAPMELRGASGVVREVLVDANALWLEGRLVHIRWFVRDITRRKQLEREILGISERERRAFSRELHDAVGQQLTGIAYLSNVVRARLEDRGLPEAAEMARVARLLKQAIDETRRLSRGLAPVWPGPEGLRTALGGLVSNTRLLFGVDCRISCTTPVEATDAEAATHLYRIGQEAVNNAVRHGRASRITVRLAERSGWVMLSIVDNGRGIGTLSPARRGLGLRVMQYRASLLGGTLELRRRPAGGTLVCCLVPATSLEGLRSAEQARISYGIAATDS